MSAHTRYRHGVTLVYANALGGQGKSCRFLSFDHQAVLERLVAAHSNIAPRSLMLVARPAVFAGQQQRTAMLGRPLRAQIASLLLDESVDGYFLSHNASSPQRLVCNACCSPRS